MKSAAVRGRCPHCKALRNGGRLKNHTDVLIFQLRVCAGATNSRSQSKIGVFLRKTPKFCSRPQRKTLRNGGKNGNNYRK